MVFNRLISAQPLTGSLLAKNWDSRFSQAGLEANDLPWTGIGDNSLVLDPDYV